MKNRSAIILLVLSVGLFYTFTNVEYKKIKNLHLLASQYQSVLANVSDVVRLRDSLLIAYEEFPQRDKERIGKVLPDNIDTVKLALELDNIALRHGVSIKDISVSDDSEGSGVAEIILPEYVAPYEKAKVSFGFISNYANFKKLLADMERNLRLMEISSLSFQANDVGLYGHKMTVETYWLKE